LRLPTTIRAGLYLCAPFFILYSSFSPKPTKRASKTLTIAVILRLCTTHATFAGDFHLKTIYILLAIFSFAAASPAMAQPSAAAQNSAGGRIMVVGMGAVQALPDMAEISLGVTTQSPSAAAALQANSAAMTAVMARLAQAGLAPRDMQTAQLNLLPNWHNSNTDAAPRITGYTAENMLNITLRDLGNLGAVLDAAVQDGANTLHGIRFGQASPPYDQARQLAVQDARSRAETMAAAAGLRLGAVLEISETGVDSPAPMMRMGAVQDMAVPLAGGEVTLSAQVRMVFELIQ